MPCIVLNTGEKTVDIKDMILSPCGLQSKEGFHILQIICFSNINEIDTLYGMSEQCSLGAYTSEQDSVAWFPLLEGCGLCLFPKKGYYLSIFYFKVLYNNTVKSF